MEPLNIIFLISVHLLKNKYFYDMKIKNSK